MKNHKCGLIFSFSLGFLLAAMFMTTFVSAVFGGLESTPYNSSVNGYTYSAVCEIAKGNGGVAAGTTVTCTNGQMKTSYVGTQTRIFDDSGVLKVSSDWNYNSTETQSFGNTAGYKVTTGAYYSRGAVRYWGGLNYTEININRTPSLDLGS